MFVTDLRRTFAAWRVQPLLPLSALVVIGLLASASSVAGRPRLVLLLLPLFAGVFGTQRVWYARAWEGRGLPPRKALSLAAGFLWEYVALFLVMAALGSVLMLPTLFLPRDVTLVYVAVTSVGWLALMDVLCTFATSAIAVGEQAVGDAISTSWRLLRTGFPRCLPHVVLPPLVLYALSDGRVGWVVAAEVVAFVARGVTTSYYVRVTGLPPVPPELVVKRNPVMFH